MKRILFLAIFLLVQGFECPAATVPAESYLAGKGQNYSQRFANVANRLNDDFNLICNDSYCHGIYDLYKPLTFHCFVNPQDGIVSTCVWAIAKSRSWIARDEKVATEGRVFFCEFSPSLTIESLIDQIEYSRAGGATPYISVTLPGVGQSLAQALFSCLM